MTIIGNIRVGKADVSPSAPSHISGVHEGNEPGNYGRQPGHLPDGKATARRSTGVNPGPRNPIDARMPVLTPA